MSRQILNTGGAANDGQGDTLRNASQKINDNFTELYTLVALGGGGGGVSAEELRKLVEDEVNNKLDGIDLDGTTNTATLLIYKSSSVETLAPEEDINVSTTYTFETGDLITTVGSTSNFNGWSDDLPTTGRYVFMVQTTVIGTEDDEEVPVDSWSDPVLIYDRGLPNLMVDIIAPNGNIFRNDIGETEVKAFITSDGAEISPADYNKFNYEWTSGGVPVCVHATTRYVSHINGNIVTVEPDGTCPIGFGIPATNSGDVDNFPNGELKTLNIEAQAVPNSGTLPLQLTINDKQED